jgi:phosphatidylethanolamine phospholipase C
MSTISKWTTDDVSLWLERTSQQHLIDIFREHRIDGVALLHMSENDLKKRPISYTILGHIKHFAHAHKALLAQNEQLPAPVDVDCEKQVSLGDREDQIIAPIQDGASLIDRSKHELRVQRRSLMRWIADVWVRDGDDVTRLLFAMAYAFVAVVLTSLAMVFIHDRVPEYAPLPDIVLDHVPLIPWAFYAVEVIIIAMSAFFFLLLCVHRHRLVVLRRMLSIMASVFLLRCLTMTVTSLSTPGSHIDCSFEIGDSVEDKLRHAFLLVVNLGSSLRGARSCGDYVFSGHSSVLTVLNYFLVHYSPASWHGFHIFSWLLNLFGCFLVLCSKEHYTLDVSLAFFISSRMFWAYHEQAGHPHVTDGRLLKRRVSGPNPVFAYLEEHTRACVPNEFVFDSTGSSDDGECESKSEKAKTH